jgi:hypothetical protein
MTLTVYVSLSDYWYARPFVPSKSDLSQISLYLEKVGNPSNLEGYIRRNGSNGLPADDVAYFYYDSNYVGSAGWYPIGINATLVVGNTYWVVLKKNGDANNTYRWYYASSTTDKYATSSDGSTWTLVSNTNALSLKTYFPIRIVVRKADYNSISKYGERILMLTDETIRDMETAKMIAEAKLNYVSKPHVEIDEIEAINVYPILEPRYLVGINLPRANINDKFEIKEVKMEFEGGKPTTKIRFRLGDTVTKLFLTLAELKKILDITRVGRVGVGLLTLYRTFTDNLAISDGVSYTSWNPVNAVITDDSGNVGTGYVPARVAFCEVVPD